MVVLCDTRGTRRQDVAILNCCVWQLLLSGGGGRGGRTTVGGCSPFFRKPHGAWDVINANTMLQCTAHAAAWPCAGQARTSSKD